MELALAIRQVWRYRIWLVPVVAVAMLAALAVTYHVSLVPPALHSKSYEYGAAEAQVLVDTRSSSLADLETPIGQVVERAAIYAELLNTAPVRQELGRIARLPWPGISVSGQVVGPGQPTAAERSSQIVKAGSGLSLYFTVNPGQPIINLYAQAPTATEARRLVSAAVTSLKHYVTKLQLERRVPRFRWVEFKQLGTPQAGTLASGAGKALAIAIAAFVFILGCFLILIIPRLVLNLRRAGALDHGSFSPSSIPLDSARTNGELQNGGGALDPGPEPVDHV